MSSDAHPANNTEATDIKIFVAVVLLLVVAAVVLGFTVGLAGIGALAIFGAAAMLALCVLLTAG